VLLRDLQAQVKQFKQWESVLAKLKREGAPASLIEQLAAMGPSALPQATALANASAGLRKQYFATYGQEQKLITKAAAFDVQAHQMTVKAEQVTLASVGGKALAGITIENVNLPGVHNARQLLEELGRVSRTSAAQRRGRHGGHNVQTRGA
jgi:hypothetical protein